MKLNNFKGDKLCTHIYLYCNWQWGIMRKIGLESPTKTAPASFLQNHPDSEMVITRDLFEKTVF